MFSFLGFRKDSKKSTSEKETDGFVIIGETPAEQKERQQPKTTGQLATNVIVQPLKPATTAADLSRHPEALQSSPVLPASKPSIEPLHMDGVPATADLLGDVPFTLAPHILAMQAGRLPLHDFIMPQDLHENLTDFCYDFTLEYSVLCEP